MSGRGLLLSVGLIALFLAVFAPLTLRVKGGRDRALDAERLRRTYVALSLYETEHDGLPAPNLGLVRRDVDESDLQSVDDPKAIRDPGSIQKTTHPSSYSWDGVVNTPARSSGPVSWSYRYHWREAGDPRSTGLDSRRGLLADPWPGVFLRVTMDGAIIERPRGDLTFEGLFGN